MGTNLTPIPEILEDARQGRMVILVDDERRENEGDLLIPAALATPDHINFMATHGRGLVCLAMTPDDIDRLELPPMTEDNDCALGTAFTVSIDAREGVTTGISAYERAHTVQTAINPQSTRKDLQVPGHIFPLRAKEGGVLERPGHTEAAIDIAKLCDLGGSGVICEVMNDDGTMARLPDLEIFAEKHGLKIGSISALIEFMRTQQKEAA